MVFPVLAASYTYVAPPVAAFTLAVYAARRRSDSTPRRSGSESFVRHRRDKKRYPEEEDESGLKKGRLRAPQQHHQKDPDIGDNTSTPASTLHTKQRVADPINWEKAETYRGARPSTTEGGLAAQRPSLQEQPSPPSPLTPPPGCITTVVACVILLFWRFVQRRGRDRAANREPNPAQPAAEAVVEAEPARAPVDGQDAAQAGHEEAESIHDPAVPTAKNSDVSANVDEHPGPGADESEPPGPGEVESEPPGPEDVESEPPGPEDVESEPPGPEDVESEPPGPEDVESEPPGPEDVESEPPGPEEEEDRFAADDAMVRSPSVIHPLSVFVGVLLVIALHGGQANRPALPPFPGAKLVPDASLQTLGTHTEGGDKGDGGGMDSPLGDDGQVDPPLDNDRGQHPPPGAGSLLDPPAGGDKLDSPGGDNGLLDPPPGGNEGHEHPPAGTGGLLDPPAGDGALLDPPPAGGGQKDSPPDGGGLQDPPPGDQADGQQGSPPGGNALPIIVPTSRGMVNEDMDCFLLAAVQMIRKMPDCHHKLLDFPDSEDGMPFPGMEMTWAVSQTLKSLQYDASMDAHDPYIMIDAFFGEFGGSFERGLPADMSLALNAILNKLNEETLDPATNGSIVDSVRGQVQITRQCQRCQATTSQIDPFFVLQLPLPDSEEPCGGWTIESLVQNAARATGGIDTPCASCQTAVIAAEAASTNRTEEEVARDFTFPEGMGRTTRESIFRVPAELCMNVARLSRNAYGELTRLNAKVNLDEEFDKRLVFGGNASGTAQLAAIGSHFDLGVGHWTASHYLGGELWVELDDEVAFERFDTIEERENTTVVLFTTR